MVSEASGLWNVHDHRQLGFSSQLETSCSAYPLPGKPVQIHRADKELCVWGKGMDFGLWRKQREDKISPVLPPPPRPAGSPGLLAQAAPPSSPEARTVGKGET